MSKTTPPVCTAAGRGRQTVVNADTIAGRITPQLREEIVACAIRVYPELNGRELSRVVAKRLGVQEAIVDSVIMGAMLAHRSEAAALRIGIRGALDLGTDALNDAWRAA